MTRLLSREGVIWLAVAVVIGFCGWYKNINIMLFLAYVMIALIAVNYWFARRQVYRVRAKRIDTPPAFAGESFSHSAEVINSSLSPVTVIVQSRAADQLTQWFVPQIPPNETRQLVSEWRFDRRGCHDLPPLTVKSGDPFGLIRCHREMTAPGSIIILPPIGRVDWGGLRRWLIRTGAGDARTRRPIRKPGLHHADVRGIRPYRPGDQVRDIHWRTSARRDELAVREYDSTEPLDLILVLDPWLPEHASDASRERLEWAITITASVCWAWAKSGESANVTLVVPGVDPSVQTIVGTRGQMRNALIPLAKVKGQSTVTDLPVQAVRRKSNRCARLFVTSRQDSPVYHQLRSLTGLPYVPLDPSMDPVWYRPPLIGVTHAH
jgi:uncharacterized protein (DUF58 family)